MLLDILLAILIVVCLSLIGVILLQRSEGGALGMSGGGPGAFMTARGTGDLLTRTTQILAAIFFALWSWQRLERDTRTSGSERMLWPGILLGISLATKHVFAFFPLWFLLRRDPPHPRRDAGQWARLDSAAVRRGLGAIERRR